MKRMYIIGLLIVLALFVASCGAAAPEPEEAPIQEAEPAAVVEEEVVEEAPAEEGCRRSRRRGHGRRSR